MNDSGSLFHYWEAWAIVIAGLLWIGYGAVLHYWKPSIPTAMLTPMPPKPPDRPEYPASPVNYLYGPFPADSNLTTGSGNVVIGYAAMEPLTSANINCPLSGPVKPLKHHKQVKR